MPTETSPGVYVGEIDQSSGRSAGTPVPPAPEPPVPVIFSVDVINDTTNFNNNLSAADVNVQRALNTIDDLILSSTALATTTDTTNFDNNLSAADSDVQKALETLNDLTYYQVASTPTMAGRG